MMKKVFLTGATGFVGAYLARYLLEKGYTVRAMCRRGSLFHLLAGQESQIEWREGDLSDEAFLEEAMQGIDIVFHSAAVISYDAADNAEMLRVNGEGTANMVNAALYAGVRRFIYVSSIAALGRKEFVQSFDESAAWENNKLNTGYAISKFRGECEVWRGIEEGLSAAIVNPSVILGAGYWHVATGQFFGQVDKGLRFYPKGSTGFVDVRDVARAALLLSESDISGERYILSGSNESYKEMLCQIAKGLGKRPPTWLLRGWMSAIAWRAEAVRAKILGTKPLITPEVLRTVQNSFTYSSQKIQSQLDFKFVPFAQTIAETAAAYQESKKNKAAFGLLPLV